MAATGNKNGDFYAVLGLHKECSETELRNAYRKLALRWHPDRCSAAGKSEYANEAKEKFQAIQEAYSTLSDSNKRFMYDVGAYDSDEGGNDMGDFLNEMVQMMSQAKSDVNGKDSFEDLQQLFVDMLDTDFDLSDLIHDGAILTENTTASSSSISHCNGSAGECGGKRRGSVLASASGKAKLEELDAGSASPGFCFGQMRGAMRVPGGRGRSRRNPRNQKAPSKHDISSDAEILA